MNFGQAIASGFKRYVDFNGRSSRSEYWFWVLFNVLVAVVLGILRVAGGGNGANALLYLYDLAVLLPSIALVVRRLHDIDRSGWWYFIVFTIVGIIPMLIWLCTPGSPGSNQFGENPLTTPKTGPSTAYVWES
jgi:uncharacterized membrane protein YhaH (DUF805 family)